VLLSFTGTATIRVAWTGQPETGNIDSLVASGHVLYSGSISATYSSGPKYWDFTTANEAKLTFTSAKHPNIIYFYAFGAAVVADRQNFPFPPSTKTLYMSGANLALTLTGNAPSTLQLIYLLGGGIMWENEGAMPPAWSTIYVNAPAAKWNGWGNQTDFTGPKKTFTNANPYIAIGNTKASVIATQHFINKLAAYANAVTPGSVTTTLKNTSTAADGVDTTPLTSLGYNVVLGE